MLLILPIKNTVEKITLNKLKQGQYKTKVKKIWKTNFLYRLKIWEENILSVKIRANAQKLEHENIRSISLALIFTLNFLYFL